MSTHTLLNTTGQALCRVGRVAWTWGLPLLVLLVMALADGLVRTFALVAIALVLLARVLIVLSDYAQRAAPSGVAARAARGGAR